MRQAAKTRNRRDILKISQSDVRPGVPHMRTVEDAGDFEASPADSYRAGWQVFIPTVAIAVLYSVAWLYLYHEGEQNGSLARLLLIVLAVGVPLVAAHAFLRHQTIRIQVMSKGIRYHPGWPRDLPVDLPFDLVERIRVKRSLVSWLVDSGTLVIDLTTGERVAIADLHQPDVIRAAVEAAIGDLPED